MAHANPVQEAIDLLGGRLEDVAVICRCTAQAVKKWLVQGRIPGSEDAALIAKATGIPFWRLAGFADEDLVGPEPSRASRLPHMAVVGRGRGDGGTAADASPVASVRRRARFSAFSRDFGIRVGAVAEAG
jgi:hypothetical protein